MGAALRRGRRYDRGSEELLRDSVRLRLRADVPVGAYLSGGLDSSLITALAQQETDDELRTFSVAFRDPRYDERAHQEEVARAIGTRHHVVEIGPADIADAFPDVVWHAESPLIRTAPVPLFLLARDVRERGITVVATGEGADELFWGYELFSEVVARELNRTDPDAAGALIDELYVSLGPREGAGPAMRRFILETGADDPLLGSHLTRATATGAVKAFYGPELAAASGADPSLERLRTALPAPFASWSTLQRAAWLEVTTLLEPYLLAAQGDRVAMGHGVEGRYPFLDHRVFAHAAALPEAAQARRLRRQGRATRGRAAGPARRRSPRAPSSPTGRRRSRRSSSPAAPEWVAEAVSDEALAAHRYVGLRARARPWSGAARPAAPPACERAWP